jgi:hypothetical protein
MVGKIQQAPFAVRPRFLDRVSTSLYGTAQFAEAHRSGTLKLSYADTQIPKHYEQQQRGPNNLTLINSDHYSRNQVHSA